MWFPWDTLLRWHRTVWAHPCHICTRTGLAPATSAPGRGSWPHLGCAAAWSGTGPNALCTPARAVAARQAEAHRALTPARCVRYGRAGGGEFCSHSGGGGGGRCTGMSRLRTASRASSSRPTRSPSWRRTTCTTTSSAASRSLTMRSARQSRCAAGEALLSTADSAAKHPARLWLRRGSRRALPSLAAPCRAVPRRTHIRSCGCARLRVAPGCPCARLTRLQLRGNDIGSNRLAGLFVTTRACPTVESNRIHHGAVGPRLWAGVLCRSLRCVGGLWLSVRREVVGLWLPCRTGLDNGIRMTKGAHGVVRDNDVYAPSLCKDAFHTRQTLRTADQRIS